MSALLHSQETVTSRTLGFNAFNHLWKVQVSDVFPPPALITVVLSKCLVEHVTSQFRLLILVAPCCLQGSWLHTVLNMLEDNPPQCSAVKGLLMDVSVACLLKSLPLLHLTLWLLRDMCCIDKGSLPSLSGNGSCDSSIYNKSLPAVLERVGKLVCSKGCSKQCHFYS